MLWITWLAACDLVELVGDEPSTLVRDVRTVAMVMDPPEVQPVEALRVEPYIFNPQGVELDVMAWSCVPDGDRCTELAAGIVPYVELGWTGDPLVLVTPPIDESLLLVAVEVPVPIHLLACESGTCPIIEEFATLPTPIEDVQHLLIDPTQMLPELPETGVHLAAHSVRISGRPLDPNQNPTITPLSAFEGGCDLPVEILAGQRVPICLETRDSHGGPMVAWSYSTAGRFESARERVRNRQVQFFFRAPTAEQVGGIGGRVDIAIVAEEDDGAGSAVFEHSFLVRPAR